MAQFYGTASLKIPKGGAKPSIWAGTKGYFNAKDVEGMIAQGYSKDKLAGLAGAKQGNSRFDPAALKALGVGTVYNYDPSQYDKSVAFSKGKASTLKGYSGKSFYSVKSTPYSLATATEPATPAAAAPAPYTPTPLVPDEVPGASEASNTSPFNINMPEAPKLQYTPGGAGAVVDGNATGVKRKKSSGRMAGLTSKGTSQFKISGQSAKSSGLNIGI